MYGGMSKASGSITEMFSHRWSKVVIGSAVVGLLAFLLVMHGERSSHEETAVNNALNHCMKGGESRAACEDRIDTHHETCFQWAHSMGGRYGGSQSTDQRAYNKCITMGSEAYVQMRRNQADEMQKERRERNERRRDMMP